MVSICIVLTRRSAHSWLAGRSGVNFAFKERYNAQFRVEFFNVLNHPLIANPFGSVNNYGGGSDPGSSPSTFGCGCTTPDVAAGNPIIGSGSSRDIQLGLKLTF